MEPSIWANVENFFIPLVSSSGFLDIWLLHERVERLTKPLPLPDSPSSNGQEIQQLIFPPAFTAKSFLD